MTGFRVAVANQIAVLTIDRPKANAIDSVTSRAMGEAFVELERDPGVRVVIITGAGERFFCAGWDLAAGEEFDVDNGVGGFGGFPDLPDRRKPVIAAVNGMAVGGGFEIAMAADLIVAADHAEFFLPEATLGLLPDAGSVRLPRLLPEHIARELLLTGRRMPAAEAAHYGLVNKVVPAADLLATAQEVADTIKASAPLSVAAVLDIGRRTANMEVADAMTAIRSMRSYRAAIDSDDAQEGTGAFAEKRPPVWKGR
ncbi:MAG: enoyl-CoA hydratase/isomerase family protein [Actinobacteria bacterium]|nr:enoyl-CoA hydratase/isomerase family protein [Actinomycetota bacterium]